MNNNILIEKLKDFKPNLKVNSINTYLTNIHKLNRHFNNLDKSDTNITNLDFLEKFDDVMKEINEETNNTKKNRLIAIVCILKSLDKDKDLIKKYQDEMTNTALEQQTKDKKQELTEKQKENWVDYDDIVKLTNILFDKIKLSKILEKENLNRSEYNLLQEYILIRFYINFPIRNDLNNVKVIYNKKDDDKENNFLLVEDNKMSFILNKYKTDKIYGSINYDIDKKFSKIINIFLKHNKSGYFITKMNMKDPITSNGITKLLNKIFQKNLNKKISTSMLRHIIITHDKKNDPTIKELEKKKKEIEKKYLHSGDMNNLYRKIK
jgi:hypothetical protein